MHMATNTDSFLVLRSYHTSGVGLFNEHWLQIEGMEWRALGHKVLRENTTLHE